MGNSLWDLAKSRFEIGTFLLAHRHKVVSRATRSAESRGEAARRRAATLESRRAGIAVGPQPTLMSSRVRCAFVL